YDFEMSIALRSTLLLDIVTHRHRHPLATEAGIKSHARPCVEVSDPFYRSHRRLLEIPPTAVGGSFRSFLQRGAPVHNTPRDANRSHNVSDPLWRTDKPSRKKCTY